MCDYPTIQDAVGEAIIDTNAIRCMNYSIAAAMDAATDNGQRTLEHQELARGNYLHWLWQLKFARPRTSPTSSTRCSTAAAAPATRSSPLELERYLRDGKAGWVMGPTNEVLRQFVGKTALLGMESLDYWNQVVNRRASRTSSRR